MLYLYPMCFSEPAILGILSVSLLHSMGMYMNPFFFFEGVKRGDYDI